MTIKVTGEESRGEGRLRATIRARLHDESGRTRVTMHTRLTLTGRAAEFDRSVVAGAIERKVTRLATDLTTDLEGVNAHAGPSPSPAPPPEAPSEPEEPDDEEPQEALEEPGTDTR